MSTAQCCLHIGKNVSTERIIPFTEQSLQTCRTKKEIRDKEKKKRSKYDDITLPDAIDATTGYHASCMRNFCSIRFKKTDSSDSLMSVESENGSSNAAVSELGIDELVNSKLTLTFASVQ